MATSEESLDYLFVYYANWLLVVSGIAILVLYLANFNIQFSYGRYGHQLPTACGNVNARIAWFIQELPCVFIPILLVLVAENDQIKRFEVTPNTVLLSMYLLHYIQRSVVCYCILHLQSCIAFACFLCFVEHLFILCASREGSRLLFYR